MLFCGVGRLKIVLNCGIFTIMTKPEIVVIHHTGDYDIRLQFNKVNEWHKSQGYPISSKGFYCFYNDFIERDGTCIEARDPFDIKPGTKAEKRKSYDMGLAGDFNQEKPTLLQLMTAKNVLTKRMYQLNILPANIKTHRGAENWITSCPGNKLSDLEIRQWFQPDISYIQAMIIRIQELINGLKSQAGAVFGKGQEENKYD